MQVADNISWIMTILINGRTLSKLDRDACEITISNEPDDLESRLKLIAFFGEQKKVYLDELVHHAVWIIEKYPDRNICKLILPQLAGIVDIDRKHFSKIQDIWDAQMSSPDASPGTFLNAATFFELNQNLLLAKQALIKALSIDPTKTKTLRELSRVYQLIGVPHELEKALVLSEIAVEAESETIHNLRNLQQVAKLSLQLGDLVKARSAAASLLELSRKQDSHTASFFSHVANTILGNICFKTGEIEAARELLARSAQIDSSFMIFFFGPDLTLANELLDAGDLTAVKEFLEKFLKLPLDGVFKTQLSDMLLRIENPD